MKRVIHILVDVTYYAMEKYMLGMVNAYVLPFRIARRFLRR